MFFVLVYGIAGFYLLLMASSIIHKEYMSTWNQSRKRAIWVMSIGLIILALYYGWLTWFLSTEEGQKHQELQQKLQYQYRNDLGR